MANDCLSTWSADLPGLWPQGMVGIASVKMV
jgi:hypothetical protein